MLKYKITPLIEQTAKDLDLPLYIVEAAVKAQFKAVADNYVNMTHVGVRLEDLGKFYFKHIYYFKVLPKVIRRYREGKLSSEVLKKFVALRPVVTSYWVNRKYKQRFGSWHWK